jgi:hypothetical protein
VWLAWRRRRASRLGFCLVRCVDLRDLHMVGRFDDQLKAGPVAAAHVVAGRLASPSTLGRARAAQAAPGWGTPHGLPIGHQGEPTV